MGLKVWSLNSRQMTIAGLGLTGVGLVLATWWLLGRTDREDGAGIANVLALAPSVIGAGTAIIGLRARPRADDPAVLAERSSRLLGRVAAVEARNLQQLLGDAGDARPADISFSQPHLVMPRWRADGEEQSGSLFSIGEFYSHLRRGRLVILGGAGAGKTVLAIALLLDLAAVEDGTSISPGRSVRVPVRLSLAALLDSDVGTPMAGRARIDKWIGEHLAVVHGLERSVADALVAAGHILPILDGLDEMDAEQADPAQARAVIAALNAPAGPGRWGVVLTCRTERYLQLACSTASDVGTSVLQDATVVTMRPLDIDQVIAWLTYRFPDPTEESGIQRRWQPVVRRLRRNPNGRLARSLASPLHLYLYMTAYQAPESLPREACALDEAALNVHLFNRLIPAITTQYPGRNNERYDPQDVTRWLRTLAEHLARMRSLGFSGVDLHWHELWRTTGSAAAGGLRVRCQAAGMAFATACVPLLAYTFVPYFEGWGMSGDELIGSVAWVIFPALVLLDIRNVDPIVPKRLQFRPPRARNPRNAYFFGLAGGLVVGAVAGIVTWFFAALANIGPYGPGDPDPIGMKAGLVVALIVGPVLAFTSDARQAEIAKPSDSLRQALTRDVVKIGAWPIAFTIGLHWSLGLLALVISLSVGLRRSPWFRYAITIRKLSQAGDLPVRMGEFLDWAHAAGLLRLAGTAVQFRHDALRDWIVSQ